MKYSEAIDQILERVDVELDDVGGGMVHEVFRSTVNDLIRLGNVSQNDVFGLVSKSAKQTFASSGPLTLPFARLDANDLCSLVLGIYSDIGYTKPCYLNEIKISEIHKYIGTTLLSTTSGYGIFYPIGRTLYFYPEDNLIEREYWVHYINKMPTYGGETGTTVGTWYDETDIETYMSYTFILEAIELTAKKYIEIVGE